MNANILYKYIKEVASPEEQEAVLSWTVKRKENEVLLLQMAEIEYVQSTHERIKSRDVLAKYQQIYQQIKQKKRRVFINRISGLAAAILIVLLTVPSLLKKDQPVPETQYYTLKSQNQRCTKVDLPDGTVVYLNAHSTLKYTSDFAKKERKVFLEGEACFKVQHDAGCRFLVSASDDQCLIEVLGTTFNVQAYTADSIFRTTLLKGSLNLKVKDTAGETKEQLLSLSERFVFNRNSGELSLRKVHAEDDIAWMSGKLIFRNTPFHEVASILSGFYQVDVTLKDSFIADYVFTGTFDNKPLETVLNYIAISSDINYDIQKNGQKNAKIMIYK